VSGTGSVILDFGPEPGSNEAVVTVSDATIDASALAEAFYMADTTADHTSNDHTYAALITKLTCGAVTAGVGFTVYARSTEKMAGTFSIRWVWASPVATAPTLVSVLSTVGSWAVGDIDGGYSTTLTGTNFTGATSVTFGLSPATSVVVVNPTTITCIAPAGASGSSSVVVTTPGGANPSNALWTYYSPAQEVLTGWVRGNFAVPWTPTVSAGGSGTNGNLVTGGADPVAGTAVSGHTPGAYGGTSLLDYANTVPTYLAAAGSGIFVMAKVNANALAPAALTYNDIALIEDGNAAVQLRYNTSGYSCTIYDGAGYQASNYQIFPTATWHCFAGWWDGVHVNGSVDGNVGAPVLAGNASVAAVALHTGCNYTTGAKANADIMEIITMATTPTLTQRQNIRAYLTTRYGQSV
jgi:hypothetical protein